MPRRCQLTVDIDRLQGKRDRSALVDRWTRNCGTVGFCQHHLHVGLALTSGRTVHLVVGSKGPEDVGVSLVT
jgi:hypothetical protein